MKEKGYQGLNIDFENVFPADRENYNQFLQRAVDRLHPEGYSVSTALAPKISGEQKGLLYEAHDYEAHGRIVDFVVLMTYEWGYRFGPPQAISPLNRNKTGAGLRGHRYSKGQDFLWFSNLRTRLATSPCARTRGGNIQPARSHSPGYSIWGGNSI